MIFLMEFNKSKLEKKPFQMRTNLTRRKLGKLLHFNCILTKLSKLIGLIVTTNQEIKCCIIVTGRLKWQNIGL